MTQEYTYHVDRGKFDQMLLEHAVELGAEAHEATAVTHVDFSGANPVVSFQDSTGKTGQVSARLIADASGRQTLLGRQLGLLIKDTVFDQFAVHTWFDNYDRSSVFVDAKFSEYIYVHFLPLTNSWVNDPTYRLDVLRLLQGDVYDEGEPEVLGKMRKIVSIVENDEKHGLHKFLGDLTGDAFRPAY